MNNNKKLIEEAKAGLAAFDEYWGTGGPVDAAYGRPWELIRGLLAVFEKALTPTDDEWQALWGIITSIRDAHRRHADDADSSEIVDAILAAGFRRTVVPEPSTEVQARGRSRGKHTDAQMLYMICLALEEGLEGVADIDLPDLIVKMISEHWGTADEDTSPEEAEAALAQLAPYIPDHMRAPEPQGEPSDLARRLIDLRGDMRHNADEVALLDAAITALSPQGEPSDAQRYRAAIEDALPMVGLMRAWNTSPAVTEQGENR